MYKRLGIIIVTLLAVTTVLYLKPSQPKRSVPTTSSAERAKKMTLYLFYNPKDQDDECKRIYAFADKAERELSDKITVKRPDIERERSLLTTFSVKVLPTILIIAPNGNEQSRFEGEGDSLEAALQKTFEDLR